MWTLNVEWSCDVMDATAQISANEPNQVLADWILTSASCCRQPELYGVRLVWQISVVQHLDKIIPKQFSVNSQNGNAVDIFLLKLKNWWSIVCKTNF